jgi:CHAT domain-containing protein
LSGAQSICLSLWKVDDTATALLMQRFYANLLGKRAGLDRPLPKAVALAEAKSWLRNLSSEEAALLAAQVSESVTRGKGRPAKPLVVPDSPHEPQEKERPFAHPNYWAGFILIGDGR